MEISTERKSVIDAAIDSARQRPISVAVFGQTGVGKSSLLNALFDLALETSDSEPCTKEPMYVDLISNSQTLRFIDLPGWGEQQDVDDGRKNEWQKLASEVDIILLVIHATSRSVDSEMEMLVSLLPKARREDVIVCCTQSDRLSESDGWLYCLNGDTIVVTIRSELDAQIKRRSAYVTSRASNLISKNCPIVYISSHNGYNLVKLCMEILKRLPQEANIAFNSMITVKKIGVVPRSRAPEFCNRVYFDKEEKNLIFDSNSFK
jgi:predicted GTPase